MLPVYLLDIYNAMCLGILGNHRVISYNLPHGYKGVKTISRITHTSCGGVTKGWKHFVTCANGRWRNTSGARSIFRAKQ